MLVTGIFSFPHNVFCLLKDKFNVLCNVYLSFANAFRFEKTDILSCDLTLSQMSLLYKSFENTVGKGEIAQNEQFLLFPPCFLPYLEDFPPFSSKLKLPSANSYSLDESKICRLGKG